VEEAVRDYDRLLHQAKHIEELQRRIQLLEEQCFAVELAHARCRATASLMPPPALSDTRVLESSINGIEILGAQIVSAAAHRDVLMQLCPPPELMEVARLERLYADLVEERSTEQHETSRVEALRLLRDPPLLGETADVERLCRSISQILGRLAADAAITGVLQDLPTVPEIQDTQHLKCMIEAVEASLNGAANRSAEVEVLSAVDGPPALIEDAGLLTSIEEYERMQTLMRAHQGDLDTLDRSLHEVRGQIAQWTEDHPTCPTCGGAIEAERLLVGAEDHNHG
jgi:exonuclease SbcC